MNTKNINLLLRNLPEAQYEKKSDAYWLAMIFYLKQMVDFGKNPENGDKTFMDAWNNLTMESPIPKRYVEDMEANGYKAIEPCELMGSRNLWKTILGKYLGIMKVKFGNLEESKKDMEFFEKLISYLLMAYDKKKSAYRYSYIEIFKIAFGEYGWLSTTLLSTGTIYEYYEKRIKYKDIFK